MPRKYVPKRDKWSTLVGLVPSQIVPYVDPDKNIDTWIDQGFEALVYSSNVESIQYRKGISSLYVKFKSGRTWRYSVPESVARSMYLSTSMGKYVHYMQRASPGVKLR